MSKPILLDAFCGAGGAAKGYMDAGFYVVGVDNKKQRNYYGDEFFQGDAVEFILQRGHEVDAIHASPPCQHFSVITPDKSKHANLIPATRDAILETGRPYIIENVPGARKELRDPIFLCGTYFDLKVYRHRFFESNVMIYPPQEHVPHRDNTPPSGRGLSDKGYVSISGSGGRGLEVGKDERRRGGTYGMSDKGFVSISGHFSGIEYCRMAMGIEWMSVRELAQAIPPAYTKWLGDILIKFIEVNNGK